MSNNLLQWQEQTINNLLDKHQADALIISSNDEHNNEVNPDFTKRLKLLTDFSGSNGFALLGKNKSIFFTDGRYVEQARLELSSKFEITNLSIENIAQALLKYEFRKIIFDANLFSFQLMNNLKISLPTNYSFINIKKLIDNIWLDRPFLPTSQVFNYKIDYSGEISSSKLTSLLKLIQEKNYENYIINDSCTINWLLNIRARDLPHTPILLTKLIVSKNGVIDLFCYHPSITQKLELDSKLEINYHNFDDFTLICKQKLTNKIVAIDQSSLSYGDYETIKKFATKIAKEKNLLAIPQACKNKIELENIIITHHLDALAVLNSWYEIEQTYHNNQYLDEIMIGDILLKYRKQNNNFISPSFSTIAGFRQNGAIIHYRPSPATNQQINGNNGLLLIDSGGQYLTGTTDITFVIPFGEIKPEYIDFYTRVLKGHIDVAISKISNNITGVELDQKARKYLHEINADYAHSTGHGVGCCLNVHEGPQALSKNNNHPLFEGMVLSNEPGYYKNGEFGIRIENLMYVENNQFKQLTMVPYCNQLIDFSQLNHEQLNYINNHYNNIKSHILPRLEHDKDLYNWLDNKLKI